mmetsp:Transcript_18422/g.45214  ORF Transcript_18422/g.45214 Transcript_18422/m.45214 type:complete len:296 (+) Transcript_18422:511-1398(+)
MFPACMSECTRLSRRNIFMFMPKIFRARSFFVSSRASAIVCESCFALDTIPSPTSVMPPSSVVKKFATVRPLAQLSTRTLGESKSTLTSGNLTIPSLISSRKLLLNLRKLYASHSKFICLCIPSTNSCLLNGTAKRNPNPLNRMSMSTNVSASTPGCWTFTATYRMTFPSLFLSAYSGLSRARWTWAMVPLATGSSLKSSKMSSIFFPKDISICLRVCSKGWLGASCRSFASAWMMSPAITSGRMEIHWPNFMQLLPPISIVLTRSRIHAARSAGSSVILASRPAMTHGAKRMQK